MGIGWSLHKNDSWRGQLERTQRWHHRLIQAASTGSSDLADFSYAFFQNCYYVREWIEKTTPASKPALDAFFKQTPELRVCRDICNGTKHLTISNASVDSDFSICWEYDPSEPLRARLCIIAGEKYDFLELAMTCLKRLELFVAENIDQTDYAA